MVSISGALARAREAWHLIRHHAADLRSKRVLLRCYFARLRTVNDPTEVTLNLRFAQSVFPIRMRCMDLFTVAEVLFEQQYAIQTPLPENPVVLDCGANVGISALYFVAHHPGAQIHAFEPEPDNYRLLKENLRSVPGARAVRAAIGSTEEAVALHLAAHGAIHSVKVTADCRGVVMVPSVRLDRYLAAEAIDHVDLLKVDVEGSETEVILGLGDRIADVSVLVGELHERLVDAQGLYGSLHRAGFRLVRKVRFSNGEEEGVHSFEMELPITH